MKKLFLVIIMIMFVSPAYALLGVSAGIKFGRATSTDYARIDLPSEVLATFETPSETVDDQMTLLGAQFKIATLPLIDFIVSAEYSWMKQDILSDGSLSYKFHDLALSASVVRSLKMGLLSPYGGVGISTRSLSYKLEGTGVGGYDIPDMVVPDDDIYTGYHILAGIDVSPFVFPVSITAQARSNWIKVGGDTSNFITLTAGLNYNFL